ncbi:Hypothetical protein CINCED_3A015343 [Cinara cedri]|uniref:Uncharacterized protein n=1 Tax=Cinara cedri TaxID=506608 RepID=A0A5E4NMZ2_9HEMI|nr:Hypothetical protein CINCED_3A015343 [Cinara cedri]
MYVDEGVDNSGGHVKEQHLAWEVSAVYMVDEEVDNSGSHQVTCCFVDTVACKDESPATKGVEIISTMVAYIYSILLMMVLLYLFKKLPRTATAIWLTNNFTIHLRVPQFAKTAGALTVGEQNHSVSRNTSCMTNDMVNPPPLSGVDEIKIFNHERKENGIQPNRSSEVYRRRQEVLQRRHRDHDRRTEPHQKVLNTTASTFCAVRRRHTSGPRGLLFGLS